MRDIEDWLGRFLARHRMRYRPFDWPDAGNEEELLYARMWVRAFREDGVTEEEADDASDSLAASPPRYRSDHIPAVLKAVRAARERRNRSIGFVSPLPGPARDPVVYPEGVGDMQQYWRWLARRMGADEADVNHRPAGRRRRPWAPS